MKHKGYINICISCISHDILLLICFIWTMQKECKCRKAQLEKFASKHIILLESFYRKVLHNEAKKFLNLNLNFSNAKILKIISKLSIFDTKGISEQIYEVPKYEQKIVRISALCSEGRNLDNFLFIFRMKFNDLSTF